MSYTPAEDNTTITRWPGDIDITKQIHEAIWEWQRKAALGTVFDQHLIDEAAAIFAIIGTCMAPAVIAERCK